MRSEVWVGFSTSSEVHYTTIQCSTVQYSTLKDQLRVSELQHVHREQIDPALPSREV